MFHILRAVLIVLTSFHTIFSEEDFSVLKEAESNQSTENNMIENMRNFVFNVSQMTDEEKNSYFKELDFTEKDFNYSKAWSELNWKMKGTYNLPVSNSTIDLRDGYALLIGDDIKALNALGNHVGDQLDEAYVIKLDDSENSILFQNINTGYVSVDDWTEIDAKTLLKETSENTEKGNIERKKNGNSQLHVVGWLQEPSLNKETNTVYWIIEAEVEGCENIVNSVAIKLGRESYENIVWVCPKSSYVASPDYLSKMLEAHHFDSGYRYEDYTIGDRIAEYGIAGLVGASIGGKLIKATGLLIFLKKFAGFIFAGISALFFKFKDFFKKDKKVAINKC